MIAGKKAVGATGTLAVEDDGEEVEGWCEDDLGLDDNDAGDDFTDAEDDGDAWAGENDIELSPRSRSCSQSEGRGGYWN